jgi:hypothetical protein
MSSVQQSSAPPATTAAVTKKKFGKNLNKLVQATAPVAGQSASTKHGHHHNHSNAGLLLLSTKKAAGGLLASRDSSKLVAATAAAAAATAAGLGASSDGSSSITTNDPTATASSATAAKPAVAKAAGAANTHMAAKPVRSLAYESAPSTHDVLLSAVVGAVAESQHETPDAWGVTAAKGSEAAAAAAAAAVASVNGAGDTTTASTIRHHGTALEERKYGMERELRPQHSHEQHQRQDDYDHDQAARFGPRFEIEMSWDEYGGRGAKPTGAEKQKQPVADTAEPLSAPATTATASTIASAATAATKEEDHDQVLYMSRLARERAEKRRSEEDARFQEQKTKAGERLRQLEQKMQSSSPDTTTTTAAWDAARPRSGSRGLWEPEDQGHDKPKQHARDGDDYHHGSNSKVLESHPPANSNYTGPVIHLSSYEDRDRGERKDSAAAPRMLYDPKSGSMVAVKAPTRGGSGGNDDSRKERGSKKVRSKNADAAASQKSENGGDNTNSKQATAANNRKNKGRKDDNRTNGTATAPVLPKVEPFKKKVNPERRLPRTCGVLYACDEKGNVYCADGCEGDLGYGAHSVRGGRARNATAYADYTEKQRQHQNQHQQQRYKNNDEERDTYDQNLGNTYETEHQQPHESDDDVALYTGFNPEEPPEPVEWIKPTDKIELVTGLDDSPTLKPTAKEWSPSQTALAAAAAARAMAAKNHNSLDLAGDRSLGDVDEMEDEDDDDDPINGLGFDPTQDMDFVMHSPAADPDRPSRLGVVNLEALALEPPMYSSSNAASDPSHIFSFGTSGTWGVNQAAPAGNSDWNVPGLAGGIFGSDAFRGGADTTRTDSTSSFLNNIPSSNSWGSPTEFGSLGGVSMNASDHKTNSTGD